jgi:hypothetical protein
MYDNESIFNVKKFGAKGDGVTDDTQAIKSAIAAASSSGGGWVMFPNGRYNLHETLIIDKPIRLGGVANGDHNPVYLHWKVKQIDGIFVERTANGTLIEKMSIIGSEPSLFKEWTDHEMYDPLSDRKGHGIRSIARIKVVDVNIGYWGLDGIHLSTVKPEQNANSTYVESVLLFGLGRHGIYTAGLNSNACLFTKVLGTGGIGGYTIYDRSFLGNTYLSCLSEGARRGFYTHSNPIATTTLIGNYQEASDGPAKLDGNVVVVGGKWGGEWTGKPLFLGTSHTTHGLHNGLSIGTQAKMIKNIVRSTNYIPNTFEMFNAGIYDSTIMVDLTNGNGMLVLPSPNVHPELRLTFNIKRVDKSPYSLWVITLNRSEIENSALLVIKSGEGYSLQSDGSKMWIMSKFVNA